MTMPLVSFIQGPDKTTLNAVASAHPANPFRTRAYADAFARLGLQPIAMTIGNPTCPIAATTAFVRAGRLLRTLTLPSVPSLPAGHPFWPAFARFVRREGFAALEVGSYASIDSTIPALFPSERRIQRCEYVWSLSGDAWDARFGTNHRRNLRRARDTGISVERTCGPGAIVDHGRMARASTARREQRDAGSEDYLDLAECTALTETGAGTLFRAVHPVEGVVSSILILTSRTGAYYHSAGTTPAGMASGASHLLVSEVASMLRADGIEVFNLGGGSSEGLHRFKSGFGTERVDLEAVENVIASPLRRGIAAVRGRIHARLRRPPVVAMNRA